MTDTQQISRIPMSTPLVEMDGDEMTRVLWTMVKQELLLPYVDLAVEYYDLGLEHRDATSDQVTLDAAQAVRRHGVGVKCATITPTPSRVREYKLKQEWRSPNATLRAALDGTVFRVPIRARNIPPAVTRWEQPIHIARHAYGDVYANVELRVPAGSAVDLVCSDGAGQEQQRVRLHAFDGAGIAQAIHNTDRSIETFARACFAYALDRGIDVWFGAKDTISKTYDARFRDIFEAEFATQWKIRFEERGLAYRYMLIDDAIAQIMKSSGGMLWACKNYDGDVMSDMVAAANGSLAMMTSVLLTPDNGWAFEAAHGTVQRHYYRHQAGEATSTNAMALIFAWTGALAKRGERDGNEALTRFAQNLEKAALATIESGEMTGDLLSVALPDPPAKALTSEAFIQAVRRRLDTLQKRA